jgi:hypothetical protein
VTLVPRPMTAYPAGMTHRSRPSRFAWLVAALFQLLVPTVWSVADAHAEAVSARTATVHVEAPGSTTCPRHHPADCVVCRVLGTASALKPHVTFELPAAGVIHCPLATAERQWISARAPGDPPQRAPPA